MNKQIKEPFLRSAEILNPMLNQCQNLPRLNISVCLVSNVVKECVW